MEDGTRRTWVAASCIICTAIFFLLLSLSRITVLGPQGAEAIDVTFLSILLVMTIQSRLIFARSPFTVGSHVWIAGPLAVLGGNCITRASSNWFSQQPEPQVYLQFAAVAVLSMTLVLFVDPRRNTAIPGEES